MAQTVRANKSEAQVTSPRKASPFPGPVAAPQAVHFWRAQEAILKDGQTFASNWFKRRHEAVQAALLAVALPPDSLSDPSAALRAAAEWQAGSVQRISEDAQEWAQMMSQWMRDMTTEEMEAVQETIEKTADIATSVTTTAKSEPV